MGVRWDILKGPRQAYCKTCISCAPSAGISQLAYSPKTLIACMDTHPRMCAQENMFSTSV